jgi:hypothetical protein
LVRPARLTLRWEPVLQQPLPSELAAALGLTEFGRRVVGPSLDEIGEPGRV